MICKNCGMENVPESKFCARCGIKLLTESDLTAPTAVMAEPAPIAPPVEEAEAPVVEEPMQEKTEVEPPVMEKTATQEPVAEEPQEPEEPVFAWEPQAYAQTAPVWTVAEPVQQNEQPAKKKKKLLWPILIGVLVLLIGMAAALYFTGTLDSLLGREEVQEEDISGYYVLQSVQVDGEALADEELVWGDYALFLLLNDDGTAVFFNGTALVACTFENGELKPDEGESMAYRAEDEKLTLTTAEGTLTFQKSEDAAPDLEELQKALDTPLEIGYFKFASAKIGDEEYDAKDLSGEDSFLLLYEDGTGIFYAEMIQDVRWEDGLIYPEGEKDDAANYRVDKDGFEMYDNSEDDIVYYFERSDETPPDIEKLREELSLPGYYIMTELTMGEQSLNISDFEENYEAVGMELPFLLVNEDGTAVLYSGTGIEDMQWDETSIWPVDAPNEKVEYQLSGGILIIENAEMGMTFERSDEEAPDIEALREKLKEPQNDTPSSVDLTGEYELYAFDMGSGMTETSGVKMILNADGTGIFSDSMNVTWSDSNLKVGTVVYTYEIDAEGNLIIDGADGKFWFKPIKKAESRWSGDWYGFWMVSECTGEMASYDEQWWDLCARSTDNGDGTYTITFWDEDLNSVEDPIGVIDFKLLDSGEIESQEGWFYMDTVSNELSSDNELTGTEDMLILEGTYSDDKCSYTYTIYLRPWGTLWEDLDESWLPYYYEQWYLPLIEAGKAMPDVFEVS